MLEIARAKTYTCPVHFLVDDAYSLTSINNSNNWKFDGGLANFWLSHVPRDRIVHFLHRFHSKLKNGSTVFVADNVYIPGVGGQLLKKKDDQENTYKLRRLKEGTEHLVLKNYFLKDELLQIFGQQLNADIEEIHYGSCYWFLSCYTY